MFLSDRAKDSIKVGLAMVIAYAIALYMDWDRPYWAGLAVAFISLETSGQSFNKGAQRIAGTLIAAVAALLILSLYPQQRWMFMVVLSSFVLVCTYMKSTTRNAYFWNVAAFVTIIVVVDSSTSNEPAFYTAMLRIEETALGVITYSVVSAVLWPKTSAKALYSTASHLSHAALGIFQETLDNGFSRAPQQYLKQQGDFSSLQARFEELSNIAQLENYEIWEVHDLWKDAAKLWVDYERAIEACRQNIGDVQTIELEKHLPWRTQYINEVEQRLTAITKMSLGEHSDYTSPQRELHINKTNTAGLKQLEKATLSLYVNQLTNIEHITYQLYEINAVIFGLRQRTDTTFKVAPTPKKHIINIGALKGAFRAFLCLWIAYIAYIYSPNLPTGPVLLILVGVYSISLSTDPYIRPLRLLKIGVSSNIFAACIYLLIMPHLHSFWSLGAVIFISVFSISYFFHSPEATLGRMFGLANFVMTTGISNTQTYSFNYAVDQLLVFIIVVAIFACVSTFTFNLRPEVQYLNLLRRFFKGASYLLSDQKNKHTTKDSAWQRYLRRHYINEIESIPHIIRGWIPEISQDIEKSELIKITVVLEALSIRLSVLMDEFKTAENSQLYETLKHDIHGWSTQLMTDFTKLVEEPSCETLEATLKLRETRLPEIEDKISKAEQEQSKYDGELGERLNIYRILGGIRSVYQALEDYEEQSQKVDWPYLKEVRF
ncbi:p-hydroxybenzoic acid efflux pump subunit AaeB [Pseudovibrio sp. Ad13]|uniref:FUSC family protein n=1 Tax=Pseudovibrio sp. Ad13 TaxID=989396 RepID=UPI0007AECB23|nr:FUSC family protein [Pseudovibrio sp. Ad13]KZK80729.1 p-hydroxybenzoic acid efflux pump subunit AaeB [Pseudovibrio sp. Ad13]